ncbi:hypothetical protein POM88_046358 [Heracleum sosnowskyi]|uniref:Uncharacterized protein n=1 Tax=Heracleum sosnowskyi TaxID=360622 RepID=A0AAD8H7I6_9APIA|nr:hypothetical protein POM88_046358 [Heracleum sosnowskyi]
MQREVFYERMDAHEDADMYMARHMALGRIPMEDVDRPSSFGDEDIGAPVVESHAREINIDPSAPVTQKSPLEVDTSAPDAPQDTPLHISPTHPLEVDTSAPDAPQDTPLHISPTHPLEVDTSAPDAPQDTPLHISPTHPLEVDTSAPDAPQDTPLHISPTHPLEVDTSAPDPLHDTPLHVSHKRPREVETSAPDPLQDTPLHVSHKRPREDETTSPLIDTSPHVPPTSHSFASSHSFAFTPIPLKASTYEETPSTERIRPFVSFGFDSASLPTILKDKFDIDTKVDKMKDERDRGGPSRKGDLTRPLKNRKIQWLFRHWWTNDDEFLWQTHSQKCVTMSLTKEKLLTLKPGNSLEDSIVNAYVELLKIRENKLWCPNHIKTDKQYQFHAVLKPTAKRFFFAFSWWMVIAARFCYDLKIPPSELTGAAKNDRDNFIETYQKQFIGPNLQDCIALQMSFGMEKRDLFLNGGFDKRIWAFNLVL